MKIIEEHGYNSAMLGLSLSYNPPLEKMPNVVTKLLKRDLNGGELKFLEQIVVWLDITAPRYFWQQFDTYRVGISKQSESTMYTLLKRELTQDDFILPIYQNLLDSLNRDIRNKDFEMVKNNLSEGFLQRRIITTNYKTLINIIKQRRNHRLSEWQYFNDYLINNLEQQEIIKALV